MATADIYQYIELFIIAPDDTDISVESVRKHLKPCRNRLNYVSAKVWEVHLTSYLLLVCASHRLTLHHRLSIVAVRAP